MSITRPQIEHWNPNPLNDMGESLTALATRLEGYFDEYVNALNGDGQWSGKAADAAHAKAAADRKVVQDLADDLTTVAQRMIAGTWEINAPLGNARNAINDAVGHGFKVADDLMITDPEPDPSEGRRSALVECADVLSGAVTSLDGAIKSVVDAINGSRDALRAAFVATEALGAEQGKTDAAAVATNPASISAEQTRRLVEGGRLTPAQIDALRAGDVATVPASQLEYINQVARSLDGKSPQEIKDVMEKLPPDARQGLANALQIGSNPKVSASVDNDPALPNKGRGGLEILPDKMRESLTRSDLVTTDSSAVSYDPTNDPFSVGINNKTIQLNGVADNTAIAQIAGMADSRYQEGTDLDRKVLDVGAKYLDGWETQQQASHGNIGGTALKVDGELAYGGDPITQDMFAAAGRDKIAVAELVTSDDGQKFVGNVLNHEWNDNGKAAATMFAFGQDDATVEDPNNAVDRALSERSGKIMSAIGQYASTDEHWEQLSELSAGDAHSVGQVNPDLVQQVGHSMTPYIDKLAGEERPDLLGFETDYADDGEVKSWLDPSENNSMKGATNVFSLIDTNDQASKDFNAAAMAGILQNEGEYAHDPSDREARFNLATAGRINALMDEGLMQDARADNTNQHEAAVAAHERKQEAYDSIKDVVGLGLVEDAMPGGQHLSQLIDGAEQAGIEDALVGDEPKDPKQVELERPNFAQRDHEVLAQMGHHITPELREHYVDLFHPDGQMKGWQEIQGAHDKRELESQVTGLFNELGRSDAHGTAFRDAYDEVTE